MDVIQKASHLLETCRVVAETDEQWLEVVDAEQQFLDALELGFFLFSTSNYTILSCVFCRGVYDEDRVSVFYQPIADRLPRLSDGKVLVETTDYKPLDKQPFL